MGILVMVVRLERKVQDEEQDSYTDLLSFPYTIIYSIDESDTLPLQLAMYTKMGVHYGVLSMTCPFQK